MTDPGLPRLADAEFLRAIADEFMANADIESSLLSDANQMNAIADRLERVDGILDVDALESRCRAAERVIATSGRSLSTLKSDLDTVIAIADALHVALCRAYEGQPIDQGAIDAAQELVEFKRSRQARGNK